MKTVIDDQSRDSVLNEWRGSDAKLWMFHVTHNRLAVMLSRPDNPEVLYLVAIGCEWIRGPFSWQRANISIHSLPGDRNFDAVTRVVDEAAGFELRCSSAALARGPATDLDTSFKNFLGDAPADD
jgi:hypothetical protein